MRMWMVDPSVMCNQHLLGEHVELHMCLGCLVKGYPQSVTGLAAIDRLEIDKLEKRHEALVVEMKYRGMNHQSPLAQPDVEELGYPGHVDVQESLTEMAYRCRDCARLQRGELGPAEPFGSRRMADGRIWNA